MTPQETSFLYLLAGIHPIFREQVGPPAYISYVKKGFISSDFGKKVGMNLAEVIGDDQMTEEEMQAVEIYRNSVKRCRESAIKRKQIRRYHRGRKS